VGSPKVKVGLSRPPLFYYSKAYTFSQENHTSLLFLFFFPQFFEVISHTQLDCDLCLLQNQTSSIELSFSLSTTCAEKGKIQISQKKTCIPLFQYYTQKNNCSLKKNGSFQKKTILVLFLSNFIFCHAFSFHKNSKKKHSERRAIFRLCSKYGWAGRS